jgi:hypothetical protein
MSIGTHRCDFCGLVLPLRDIMVHAKGPAICKDCAASAKDVIRRMQATYSCHVCNVTVPGYMMVEGPARVHLCEQCIDRVNTDLGAR